MVLDSQWVPMRWYRREFQFHPWESERRDDRGTKEEASQRCIKSSCVVIVASSQKYCKYRYLYRTSIGDLFTANFRSCFWNPTQPIHCNERNWDRKEVETILIIVTDLLGPVCADGLFRFCSFVFVFKHPAASANWTSLWLPGLVLVQPSDISIISTIWPWYISICTYFTYDLVHYLSNKCEWWIWNYQPVVILVFLDPWIKKNVTK
jgi:hypothetical protein